MAETFKTREEWLSHAQLRAYDIDWNKDIPKEFLDEDFICSVVQQHAGVITKLPKSYLSEKVLNVFARAIYPAGELESWLDELSANSLETWSEHLCAFPDQFGEIPERYQTEEMANLLFAKNASSVFFIPERFQTEKMWLTYAETCREDMISSIPKRFKTNEFFERIAERGLMGYIPKNFQTHEMWYNCVKNDLVDISLVPMEFQTQEMWNYLVSSEKVSLKDVPTRFQNAKMAELGSSFDVASTPSKFYSDKIESFDLETQEKIKLVDLIKSLIIQEKINIYELSGPIVNFISIDMYRDSVEEDPNNVHKVPSEFQTQEMWFKLVQKDPYEAIWVPRRFQTAEMWQLFIEQNPKKIGEVPKGFQTQEMWEAHIEKFPSDIYKVPREFQTSEMWENSEVFYDAPEILRTASLWKKIVEFDSSEYTRIPKASLTEEIVEVALKKHVCTFNNTPRNFWTSEFIDECVSFYNGETLIYHFEKVIPKELLTRSICQRYLEECSYNIGNALKIPEKYQTQDMWNEVFARNKDNAFNNLKFGFVPLKFQTQDMWDFLAKNNFLSEENLNIVPKQFLEGVKHIMGKDGPKKQVGDSVFDATTVDNSHPKAANDSESQPGLGESIEEESADQTSDKLESVHVENVQLQAESEVLQEDEKFNKIMASFANAHRLYYDGVKGTRGHAHTKEEIEMKKSVNKKIKKYIASQINKVSKSEANGFEGLVEQLTNPVDESTINDLTKNKGACLRLMSIMSSGIYEKDGQKIRLTQKQRVALASVMSQVSEKMIKKESEGLVVDKKVYAEME